METTRKHVQETGEKAGQWVDCPAKIQCRNGGIHISAETLKAVQLFHQIIREETISLSRIPLSSVKAFQQLSLNNNKILRLKQTTLRLKNQKT